MSNWTHVAACIRIDDWPYSEEPKKMEAIFGKELSFYDGEAKWTYAREHPREFLPMGSEGSLQMSVWENPDKYCTDRYAVSIFGDLRNHDDPFEVINWLKEKLDGIARDVRGATIIAENERREIVAYAIMIRDKVWITGTGECPW